MIRLAAALAAVAALALPITAQIAAAQTAGPTQFRAELAGTNQVPPKPGGGTGTATAQLDPATKVLTYRVEYTGLSGPATAAHFHGPAEPTANAGVVVPFANAASPITGTATLTDAQVADLSAGKWYANVHTAANPGGEIRGQMAPAP